MKKEKKFIDENYRKQIIATKLLPFYENQAKLRLNNITKVDGPDQFNIIYPSDRYVILNPVKITDEKGATRIRYFVFLPETDEIFEWTLVPPYLLHKDEYMDEPVTKAIGSLTTWNYSYKTLDDDHFWSEKVLLKEGGKYKYLTKLQ